MVKKNKHIIIQARTSSTRFPQKVIKKIGDDTLLGLVIKRVKQATKVDQVIVATSSNHSDDLIENIAEELEVHVYRGSLEDVLDRYYQASVKYKSDIIIRITGDCPLIDPKLIDAIVERFEVENLDYLSNTLDPKYPDGQDIEVFSFEALEKAWKFANLNSEREHVTPFIHKNSSYLGQTLFKADNFDNPIGDYSDLRITVDNEEDFFVIQSLIKFGGINLTWESYIDILTKNQLYKLNNKFLRNEGLVKSKEND